MLHCYSNIQLLSGSFALPGAAAKGHSKDFGQAAAAPVDRAGGAPVDGLPGLTCSASHCRELTPVSLELSDYSPQCCGCASARAAAGPGDEWAKAEGFAGARRQRARCHTPGVPPAPVLPHHGASADDVHDLSGWASGWCRAPPLRAGVADLNSEFGAETEGRQTQAHLPACVGGAWMPHTAASLVY